MRGGQAEICAFKGGRDCHLDEVDLLRAEVSRLTALVERYRAALGEALVRGRDENECGDIYCRCCHLRDECCKVEFAAWVAAKVREIEGVSSQHDDGEVRPK